MITSWNVRGLNKLGKNREISSCLYSLKPNIAVLIENRVNQPKADKNGKNLSVNRSYIDNYSKHNNGRIWTPWEASRVQVRFIKCIEQVIHRGICALEGSFKNWFTVVYDFNKLEQRKIMWKDIERLSQQQ